MDSAPPTIHKPAEENLLRGYCIKLLLGIFVGIVVSGLSLCVAWLQSREMSRSSEASWKLDGSSMR